MSDINSNPAEEQAEPTLSNPGLLAPGIHFLIGAEARNAYAFNGVIIVVPPDDSIPVEYKAGFESLQEAAKYFTDNGGVLTAAHRAGLE